MSKATSIARQGFVREVERRIGQKTARKTYEHSNGDDFEHWDVTVSLRKVPPTAEERIKLGLDPKLKTGHLLYCEGKVYKTTSDGEHISECHFTLHDFGGDEWSVQQVSVGVPDSWSASSKNFIPTDDLCDMLKKVVLNGS